jgi:hypothetical protein
MSKRPSKFKPMPTPVPLADAQQPSADVKQSPAFAWLGIIGAVVLVVCYRIWKRRAQ